MSWIRFDDEMPPEANERVPDREYWFMVNFSQSKSKTPRICFRKGNTLYDQSFRRWREINDDTCVRWMPLPKLVIDNPKPIPCKDCGVLGCTCWWDNMEE